MCQGVSCTTCQADVFLRTIWLFTHFPEPFLYSILLLELYHTVQAHYLHNPFQRLVQIMVYFFYLSIYFEKLRKIAMKKERERDCNWVPELLVFAKQKLRASVNFGPPAGNISSDEYRGQ